MSDITVRVSEYVRNKGINLLKMSRETGLSYRSLYDSLLSKKRNRDLRDHEFMSVCFFLGVDPREFTSKENSVSERR